MKEYIVCQVISYFKFSSLKAFFFNELQFHWEILAILAIIFSFFLLQIFSLFFSFFFSHLQWFCIFNAIWKTTVLRIPTFLRSHSKLILWWRISRWHAKHLSQPNRNGAHFWTKQGCNFFHWAAASILSSKPLRLMLLHEKGGGLGDRQG